MRTETSASEGPSGPGVERHRVLELSSRHPQQELIGSEVEWARAVEYTEAEGAMVFRYVDERSDLQEPLKAVRGEARV